MDRVLSVGEAKAYLRRWRSEAESLLGKLQLLDPNAIVVDTRVASGPLLSPPMFAKCAQSDGDYVTAADFVMGMEGLIEWLDGLMDCLDAPDDRPFAEGELSD